MIRRIFAIAVLSFLLASCNNTPTTNTTTTDTANTVTNTEKSVPFTASIADVCGDFTANMENAMAKYGTAPIDLTGTIKLVNNAHEHGCNYITFDCNPTNAVDSTKQYVIRVCKKLTNTASDSIQAGTSITIRVQMDKVENNVILFNEVTP